VLIRRWVDIAGELLEHCYRRPRNVFLVYSIESILRRSLAVIGQTESPSSMPGGLEQVLLQTCEAKEAGIARELRHAVVSFAHGYGGVEGENAKRHCLFAKVDEGQGCTNIIFLELLLQTQYIVEEATEEESLYTVRSSR
jgi:hypothetical protein